MDPWLTTWLIHPHRFWKYRPQGMISMRFRHCWRRCDQWWRHPGSTQQGELLSDRMHITNKKQFLTIWSIRQLGIGKYPPWGTILTASRHSWQCCDRRWCYQSWQNKLSSCQLVHIFQPCVLTAWLYHPHGFWKNCCDGRYGQISSSSTTMLLFFLLFGVRCRSTRAYECFSTGCNVSDSTYIVHTVHTIFSTRMALIST
jgi:hypothetical protein